MARQMTPAQMVAAFRKWKVDLHLYPGWETRGYGPGSISDAQGVMIHHTGSDAGQSDDYLGFLFVRGRPPEVPAPLCNWATDMDGDLWLGAAERANHAGKGSSVTLSKVSNGSYDWRSTQIKPGADNINGNIHYYGNECRFDGGQPMTRAMWVTVVLSSAAVCDFHGWGAWHVIGHKEHTSRKIDPGSTLMNAIRRDVAAALTAGPGQWPTATPVPTEDDMAGEGPAILAGVKRLEALFAKGGSEAKRYSALQDAINATKALVEELKGAVLPGMQASLSDHDRQEDARYGEYVGRFAAISNQLDDIMRAVSTTPTDPPAPTLPKA